jgi:hypothetical protein
MSCHSFYLDFQSLQSVPIVELKYLNKIRSVLNKIRSVSGQPGGPWPAWLPGILIFYTKLKKMRAERSLTQRELGKLSKVSHEQIAKYEKDKANPSPIILLRNWHRRLEPV